MTNHKPMPLHASPDSEPKVALTPRHYAHITVRGTLERCPGGVRLAPMNFPDAAPLFLPFPCNFRHLRYVPTSGPSKLHEVQLWCRPDRSGIARVGWQLAHARELKPVELSHSFQPHFQAYGKLKRVNRTKNLLSLRIFSLRGEAFNFTWTVLAKPHLLEMLPLGSDVQVRGLFDFPSGQLEAKWVRADFLRKRRLREIGAPKNASEEAS